jgi:hypothetical protein
VAIRGKAKNYGSSNNRKKTDEHPAASSSSSNKFKAEVEMDSSSAALLQSKRSKKKGAEDAEQQEDSLIHYDEDDNRKGGRFDTSKPQFRKASGVQNDQLSSKVVLDERFSSVLTDPRFQVAVKRDKYGRKSSKKTKKSQQELAKKELSAFYTIEDKHANNDDDEKDDEKPKADEKTTDSMQHHQEDDDDDDKSSSSNGDDDDAKKDGKRKQDEPTKDSYDDDDNNNDKEDPMSRIAYLTALSRGEIDVSSSSSSSDEDDDDDDSDDASSSDNCDDDDNDKLAAVMGKAGVLDPSSRDQTMDDDEVPQVTTEPSPFLAVMDMDWSNIRAVDLFAIVASFTPAGAVKCVRVFPSDFGMAKMQKEEQMGPSGLWKNNNNEEDDKFQREEEQGQDDGDSANHPENGQDYDSEQDDDEDNVGILRPQQQNDHLESDFDPEQLRAYEASRLKYYFAIVELASPEHADIAYKEVDGMEFEHSSAALDVRSIPVHQLSSIVKDRPLRDEASSIPSNYVPPDFVVSALQQTNVQCTWEAGDRDRERALTKYASSGQDWKTAAENDDLNAYLASDNSSDEEEQDNDDNGKGGSKEAKAARIRKMLGLDSDSEDGGGAKDVNMKNSPDEDESESSSSDSDNDGADFDAPGEEGADDTVEGEKQAKFIPGEEKLQDKIRSKLKKDTEAPRALTPWEKYQEKRKEKKRAKRQEAKDKRNEINQNRKSGSKDRKDDDEFFMGSDNEKEDDRAQGGTKDARRAKQELELLVAGDDNEEEARDYDMRGLQRIEKNKDKKLRGARKRKEAALAATVGGTEFEVNVRDDRFRAVLDGQDDRFGIDKTDSSYKDTSAMRGILEEQSKRRKQKQRKKAKTTSVDDSFAAAAAPPDANAEDMKTTSGASALSFLVSRLKSKVSS